MSFSLRGYNLATMSVAYINGVAQLGAQRLTIGVRFNVPARRNPFCVRDLNLNVDIVVLGGGKLVQRLGSAIPAANWQFVGFDFPMDHTCEFSLALSNDQLAAVEEYRGQDGLRFQLSVSARAIAADETEPLQETCSLDVNLSRWIEIMNGLGASETLLVPVSLPMIPTNSRLGPSLKVLRKAHDLYRRGEYEGVIANARLVLEALRKFRSGSPDGALEQYLKSRKPMTREDRQAMLIDATYHFTHLAHHVRADGDHDVFSRAEATAILAATTSLLGIAASREG